MTLEERSDAEYGLWVLKYSARYGNENNSARLMRSLWRAAFMAGSFPRSDSEIEADKRMTMLQEVMRGAT